MQLTSLLSILPFLSCTLAHPGEQHTKEDIENEIRARSLQNIKTARSLRACESSLKYRALQDEAAERRLAKMKTLRKQRGVDSDSFKTHRRDLSALESWDAVSTNYTTSSYTLSTSASTLFGSNASCILASEVTQGPYYARGEYVRENLTESQSGVPIHLELQFIDSTTCEAVNDMYLDVWNANATGVYSGVVANGNGDASDLSNINNTALRGIQPVDSSGVVQFNTLVPGFYSGRAPHIHLLATMNATLNSNNTITGGNIAHVGQLFFAQDLLTQIYETAPYTDNTATLTLNDEDSIAQAQASTSYDPYVNYAYLGDDVSEGLLAWISIAVDTGASYTVAAASVLTEDGGESSGDEMGGSGAPSGSGGNGTVSMSMAGGMNGSIPTGMAGGNFSAVSTMSIGQGGAMPSDGNANGTMVVMSTGSVGQGAAATASVTGSQTGEVASSSATSTVTATGRAYKTGVDAYFAAGVAGLVGFALLGFGGKWFFF